MDSDIWFNICMALDAACFTASAASSSVLLAVRCSIEKDGQF